MGSIKINSNFPSKHFEIYKLEIPAVPVTMLELPDQKITILWQIIKPFFFASFDQVNIYEYLRFWSWSSMNRWHKLPAPHLPASIIGPRVFQVCNEIYGPMYVNHGDGSRSIESPFQLSEVDAMMPLRFRRSVWRSVYIRIYKLNIVWICMNEIEWICLNSKLNSLYIKNSKPHSATGWQLTGILGK